MKALLQNLLKRFDSVSWGGVLIENGALSLGRMMLWIVFGLLIYMWMVKGGPIPGSLMDAFWGLLIYNGGKKVTDPLSNYLLAKEKGKETKAPEDVPRVTEIDALEEDDE